MNGAPTITEEQRRALLLLEATGILHDVGKLHGLFLKSKASNQDFDFPYWAVVNPERVLPDGEALENRRAPYKDLSPEQQKTLVDATFRYDEREQSVARLLLIHKGPRISPYSDFTTPFSQLLNKVHGISHYEKEGVPNSQKQSYDQMHRASPFGVKSRITTEDSELTKHLGALPLSELDKVLTEDRLAWLQEVQEHLQVGIADTREPINEVTLWDWGWTVASFAKAALAAEFYGGPPINTEDLKWRILRINLDVLGLLGQPAALSDVIGVRDTLESSLKAARQQVEEKWALGNQLYDDTTGAYFVLPDMNLPAGLKETLHACFDEDLELQVALEDASIAANHLDPWFEDYSAEVRKLVAEPLQEARRALREPPPNYYLTELADMWENHPTAEPCVACRTRPQGYTDERVTEHWAKDTAKAKDRDLCCICLQRRGRRSQEWTYQVDDAGPTETMWVDEVADESGRFALIVGHLGIDAWMEGRLVETLQLQRYGRGGDDQDTDYSKSPSPSRLTRMRRTCQEFWELCEKEDIRPEVGRAPRWALVPKRDEIRALDDALADFHTYEIPLAGGTTLPVVWDSDEKRLLTAGNLAYVGKNLPEWGGEDPLLDRVRLFLMRTLGIREGSEYRKPARDLGVSIELPEVDVGLPEYVPFIRILLRPSTYLALVPADKALAITKAIWARYRTEFGRVRDRLPLHLGLVFAPRRTPMRALLDSARSMLQAYGEKREKEWELMWAEPAANEASAKRKLHFENGVTWTVPEDNFYPYFHAHFPDEKSRLLHLNDMPPGSEDSETGGRIEGKGLQVQVRPSTFDFTFLDATGRRFEIYYDDAGCRPARPTRPWLLEDFEKLEELWERVSRLTKSQIHQVMGAIEEARPMWPMETDEERCVFRQFVSDTLAGANWPHGAEWKTWDEQEKLIDAGVTGKLTDLVELHLQILKEKE